MKFFIEYQKHQCVKVLMFFYFMYQAKFFVESLLRRTLVLEEFNQRFIIIC